MVAKFLGLCGLGVGLGRASLSLHVPMSRGGKFQHSVRQHQVEVCRVFKEMGDWQIRSGRARRVPVVTEADTVPALGQSKRAL